VSKSATACIMDVGTNAQTNEANVAGLCGPHFPHLPIDTGLARRLDDAGRMSRAVL
jgi:hypothetical protein